MIDANSLYDPKSAWGTKIQKCDACQLWKDSAGKCSCDSIGLSTEPGSNKNSEDKTSSPMQGGPHAPGGAGMAGK